MSPDRFETLTPFASFHTNINIFSFICAHQSGFTLQSEEGRFVFFEQHDCTDINLDRDDNTDRWKHVDVGREARA